MAKTNKSQVFDENEEILDELEDDEDTVETPLSEAEIERKYDEGQARIVIQRNDFLVPNLMTMFEKREILDMNPIYQRRSRWNDKKRSQLIESLLMNVPIPPIFLYETDYAKYEVMDGQQRLTAIRSFMKNEFKLRGLRLWSELNGRQFANLPPRIQKGLERRGIAAVIILTESGKDTQDSLELRQYVFERLNTGGERLNFQEIRNCLYASEFNNMLIRIARSDLFTSAWDIPPRESGEPNHVSRKLERNTLYSKMADVEIVLRYFALSDMTKFRGAMKRTLDDCMIRNKSLTETECKKLEQEYLDVLDTASSIYGKHLFRLRKNGDGLIGRRSAPLADAVLLAVRYYWEQKERLIANRNVIVSGTEEALANSEGHEMLVGHGNTRRHVEERFTLMRSIFNDAIS